MRGVDVKSILIDGFDQWECIDIERNLERRTLGNTRENWIPVQLTGSNDINCGEWNAEKQAFLEKCTQVQPLKQTSFYQLLIRHRKQENR